MGKRGRPRKIHNGPNPKPDRMESLEPDHGEGSMERDFIRQLNEFNRGRDRVDLVVQDAIQLDSVAINVYKLAKLVELYCGVYNIHDPNLWGLLCRKFGLLSPHSLKQVYFKYIYEFESRKKTAMLDGTKASQSAKTHIKPGGNEGNEIRQAIDILKGLSLELFRGGSSSRIIKSLECGQSLEIDWALESLELFSSTLDKVFALRNTLGVSGLGAYCQSVSNLAKSLFNGGLLDMVVFHTDPFFRACSLLTESPESIVLNIRNTSKLYGYADSLSIQTPWLAHESMDKTREYIQAMEILGKIVLRATRVCEIIHNLTFLPLEEVQHMARSPAFVKLTSRGMFLINALSKPMQQRYRDLGKIFGTKWIRVSNFVLNSVANVLLVLDPGKVEGFFDMMVSVIQGSEDRYHVYTATDILTRCLHNDACADRMAKLFVERIDLQDKMIEFLLLPDKDLSLLAIEFVHQLLVVSCLPIPDNFLTRLVPTVFGLLLDSIELPIKDNEPSKQSSNLFSGASMTIQQKTIKWIAMSYQAGTSSHDVIRFDDIFLQYKLFFEDTESSNALGRIEFFHLLSQIYPKSIPPKSEWPTLVHKCMWTDCSTHFANIGEIHSHLQVHLGEGVECRWGLCGQKMNGATELLSHLLIHALPPNVSFGDLGTVERVFSNAPSYLFLKPRTVQEKTLRASDRSLPLLLILSRVSNLSSDQGNVELIKNLFLPHLETIFLYMSYGDRNNVKLVSGILSAFETSTNFF